MEGTNASITRDVGLTAKDSSNMFAINNPVTVDVQKMTAATGEVNLTIGQTTNSANTAISALYKFTDLYDLDQRITAGTNITINAGTTTTNIDSKTALFGIAGSMEILAPQVHQAVLALLVVAIRL